MKHLNDLGTWNTIGLGRRERQSSASSRFIPVDLLDSPSCHDAFRSLPPVHVVFFVAYAPRSSPAEEVEPNLAILKNLVTAIAPNCAELERVVLLQGSKWYGNHIGPYKTPSNEDDPRIPVPNFYYAQQDWLSARQQGQSWTWSALRPHAVMGFNPGSPMSLLNVLAVYAAVSKHLATVLRFPGTDAAYNAVYQMTDARLLARAMVWAATEPACANRAFNLTNGDLDRWSHLWPKIAAAFDMEPGPALPLRLDEVMAGREPLWREMVERYSLQNESWNQVVSWKFGDFVFHSGYDHISNMTRARQAGWCEALDTEQMLIELLKELRTARVVP